MTSFMNIIVKACCIAVISQVLAAAPSVKLPPYKKTVLKNGMTVVLMEQHKVPLVDLQLTLRTGNTADPIGKDGRAAITSGLLRKGTKNFNTLQISEALDSVGAYFVAGSGLDSTTCTAEFMAKDISKGLELFAELIVQPTFPEDEFKKLQAQAIDRIRAFRDNAGVMLGIYGNAFLYDSHPYGRGMDENSLASITHSDILACYKSNYTPANAILVVVGDFKTAEMEKMISARFGNWKSSANPPTVDLPQPSKFKGQKLLLVDKPDATQTYFSVGNIGVARDNPDHVAIQVVNTVFGGSFTSMINTALRIKSGLTYGASASFRMSKVAGPFLISSFTANETTEKALELTLETLKELHEKGITQENLESAKAYIKGTFPPQTFETGSQLAARLSDMQLHNLPDSDVNDFFAKVDAVTLVDANRIIKTYYPENDLCFVLVGKADMIRPTAEKFAKEITVKSISGPGF
ncbi:MAG: insulinase family protein [Holophagales bacterium]|jgi:predicted Zn-dependent peptidase|nr:insulinase family protein [Holophagales bacterium]